jgi:hypothetical protein
MSRTYSALPAELIRLRDLSAGSHVVVLVSYDTTMSIRYGHVHWKKSPPNSSKLDRIRQVVYRTCGEWAIASHGRLLVPVDACCMLKAV